MKALLCGSCGDVRALDVDNTWTICRCSNTSARWEEAGLGQNLLVRAKDKSKAWVLIYTIDGEVCLTSAQRVGEASASRWDPEWETPAPTPPRKAPASPPAASSAPPPPVDLTAIKTLGGTPIGEHREIDPSTGMQKDYIVLTAEERSKGFVRPIRASYKHVGSRPKYPLRNLTPDEKERYKVSNYAKFEAYPEGSRVLGRFWTDKDLNSGCNTVTTMGNELAETYARSPTFYGATMCRQCKAHFPVGEDGEFVWVGTDEKVGT